MKLIDKFFLNVLSISHPVTCLVHHNPKFENLFLSQHKNWVLVNFTTQDLRVSYFHNTGSES